MGVLIVIIVVILIGAFFLLRSPAPNAATAPQVSDAEAHELRDQVLRKLQDRLVGWVFETPDEAPYEVVALEEATHRRIVLNLKQLAEAWRPMHAAGDTEGAETLVESFVQGTTGEGEGEESGHLEMMNAALALALVPADRAPKAAITREVGHLAAVLVLRSAGGPEPVTREELTSWGLSEVEAFDLAFENLSQDVEDGLTMQTLNDEETTVRVAPGDLLAASYALVPGLAERLKKKLGGPVVLLLGEKELVATTGDASTTVEGPLVEGPLQPGALVWQRG